MSGNTREPWWSRRHALYILGAGFSAAAGLPLADELWREVCRRAMPLTGRLGQFREDLDYYIEFKECCDGVKLSREDVNFEEFLGFLDVEHHLLLRGKDTWSDDGNESQLIVKTLIGQILTERTPQGNAIPQLYLDFADKLQPGDRVITFNYDILLERACEAVFKPYRLALMRYADVNGRSTFDSSHPDEVTILKLHGSIDWFDRRGFRLRQEWARKDTGNPNYVPRDPIFNSPHLETCPVVEGHRPDDDPLREVYRVRDIEWLYADPPFLLSTPKLISPSTVKVVYSQQFGDYWYGQGQNGAYNFRLVVIGYSLPAQDDYARQVLYRLITNYQGVPVERVRGDPRQTREPVMIVNLCNSATDREKLLKAYRFVDWAQARLFCNGLNHEVVAAL